MKSAPPQVKGYRDVTTDPMRSILTLNLTTNHVHGSGIWSNIARKIMGTATKGVIVNKVGHTVLDGATSAVRKRTEECWMRE